MRYLNNWRMQVAAQRLRECTQSVAQIAAEVGYESEFAFAKAFKRAFAVTPAGWRRRSPAAAPTLKAADAAQDN
jgi:AraC-like DNA-binding protein